jgi:hypothetical protein
LVADSPSTALLINSADNAKVKEEKLDKTSEKFADEVRKSLTLASGSGSDESSGIVTDSTQSGASSAYRMRTNVIFKKKVTLSGSQLDIEEDRE